jgi:hypothetical protein
MPKQNRVTPFGMLIAVEARGRLMGNRGCLHDDQQQIQRLYRGKRWIICQLEFKGRKRTIMAPGLYTELFFLDEATALAAGHRPCAECMRPRFNTFRSLWATANPVLADRSVPLATTIDDVLHKERVAVGPQKVTYLEQLARLPDGSLIVLEQPDQAYLVRDNALIAWSPAGYRHHLARPTNKVVQVLTPRSTVRTLAHGYSVDIHPSALIHCE